MAEPVSNPTEFVDPHGERLASTVASTLLDEQKGQSWGIDVDGGWKRRDRTHVSFNEPNYRREVVAVSAYDIQTMPWGSERTTSASHQLPPSAYSNRVSHDDLKGKDRVVLLAKKYANEKLALEREDEARLEMLTQEMDLKYPRYSDADWQLLDEAESLIDEIQRHLGDKS